MYKVELTRDAAKDLEKVYRADRSLYNRFIRAFEEIAQKPTEGKPLHGKLQGLFSRRLGHYRILYEIRHKVLVVLVVDLGHRREIYR